MRLVYSLILLILGLANGVAHSQEAINRYSKECSAAIGGDIPKFRCDEGEIITLTGAGVVDDYNCDNPAHLSSVGPKACIKGSRFQKLKAVNIRPGFDVNDIEIRLLCRHYERPAAEADINNLFDDIAIIATNIKNGATCFFQSKTGRDANLDGNNVPPPSDPSHKLFDGGARNCVSCHAIRPFIETPYLASVSPKHKIRNIQDFPRDKYWFPGEPSTIIYSSSIPGQNTCTSCHNIASTLRSEYNQSALEVAHQSIGISSNSNVNKNIPYMLRFASSDAARAAIAAHESCFQTGSNCIINDISTPARIAFERGTTVPSPSSDPGSGSKVDPNKVYTIVSSNSGKCLDARGGSPQNGTRYQQYDCNGEIDQKFRFVNVKTDEFEIRAINGNRCVSSEAGKIENGNPMILWDCGGGSDQHVRLLATKGGAFKIQFSNSGKCMDIQGESSKENNKDIHQWDCGDVADQAWLLRETSGTLSTVPSDDIKFDGKIYNFVASHSNKCLDARGGSPENGTVYQQFDCNGAIDQKFRLVKIKGDEYQIRAENGGRCVSSEAGKTNNGNPMILWDCGNGSDQLVRLLPAKNGAFKVKFSNSGKCMDIQGESSSENNKDIHQWDCGDNADQAWYLRETW